MARLAIVTLIPLYGSPGGAQLPVSFDDHDTIINQDSITYTELTPHKSYKIEYLQPNFYTTALVNECGIIKIKPPSEFKPTYEPYNDKSTYIYIRWAGGEKWGLYYNNKDYYKSQSAKPEDMTCERKALFESWGWTWASTANKTNIWVWANDAGIPNNTKVQIGLIPVGQNRSVIKTGKANACGILTFKFYYSWPEKIGDSQGVVADYGKGFKLRDGETQAQLRFDNFENTPGLSWYHRPFCNKGRLYLPDDLLYDDDQE